MTGGVFWTTSYRKPFGRVTVRPFSVTAISTAPAVALAGVFAVIVSVARTVTSDAARPPTITTVPAPKPPPRIVTSVPPVAGPALGVTVWMTRSTTTGPGFVGELQLAPRTASVTVAIRASEWRNDNWGKLETGTLYCKLHMSNEIAAAGRCREC